MTQPEYMWVPIKHFPEDITSNYSPFDIMDAKGNVFIKIKMEMYGLKQASILAYE